VNWRRDEDNIDVSAVEQLSVIREALNADVTADTASTVGVREFRLLLPPRLDRNAIANHRKTTLQTLRVHVAESSNLDLRVRTISLPSQQRVQQMTAAITESDKAEAERAVWANSSVNAVASQTKRTSDSGGVNKKLTPR